MIEEVRGRHVPAQLDDGIEVRSVGLQEFYQVTAWLSDRIFASNADLGLYERSSATDAPVRALAARAHVEPFVFVDPAGRPIGFSLGRLTDGQTFFMEWSGILPSHQRRGLYSRFLDVLFPYLRDLGVERVTSNHMGTNRPVLIAKLKAGFVVTGLTLDERHGAVVWLTRFLDEERADGFRRAFSLDDFDQPPS